MGILGRLFSSVDNSAVNSVWVESIEEIDQLIDKSYHKPVAIFKHSTRCSISSVVMNRTINDWDQVKEMVDIYFIDLIAYRNVSNYIAEALQIDHQSPQIIIIKEGEPLHNSSHNCIRVEDILRSVDPQ